MLKLQIRSKHGIRQIHWLGDTQALSLTSPANGNSSDGWSVIMPAWDDSEGAKNAWRLTAVVEDKDGSVSPPMRSRFPWRNRSSQCLPTIHGGSCCRMSKLKNALLMHPDGGFDAGF